MVDSGTTLGLWRVYVCDRRDAFRTRFAGLRGSGKCAKAPLDRTHFGQPDSPALKSPADRAFTLDSFTHPHPHHAAHSTWLPTICFLRTKTNSQSRTKALAPA